MFVFYLLDSILFFRFYQFANIFSLCDLKLPFITRDLTNLYTSSNFEENLNGCGMMETNFRIETHSLSRLLYILHMEKLELPNGLMHYTAVLLGRVIDWYIHNTVHLMKWVEIN